MDPVGSIEYNFFALSLCRRRQTVFLSMFYFPPFKGGREFDCLENILKARQVHFSQTEINANFIKMVSLKIVIEKSLE